MVTSVWEDIKKEFQHGDMVTRIILVNVAVFAFVKLLLVGMFFIWGPISSTYLNDFLKWLEASSGWYHNLTRPWTIITHMFLHEGFMHILFNMLFLYWFGRIFQNFTGNHRILPVYILSGLAGFVAYVIAGNVFPGVAPYALGASAGVMGIVWATATLTPNYQMHLMFIGPVRLKYIAIILTFIDLVSIPAQQNIGGHFAHIGGAIMGWFFIQQLNNGQDFSIIFNNFLAKIKKYLVSFKNTLTSRKKPHVAYRNPKAGSASDSGRGRESKARSPERQDKINQILDKINRSGYSSLTTEEKEFLFNSSKDD